MEIRQKLVHKNLLIGKLLTRLKFSALLELPESDFARLIAEIEQDPLFRKLFYAYDYGTKAIFKRRFPDTSLSQSFYELNEQIKASTSGIDVENLLAKHHGMLELIRKIGQKKFEGCFLYEDSIRSVEEIAKECAISTDEVQQIQSMLLELSIHSEFFHPTTLANEGQTHYTLIARLERDSSGHFIFSYLSPHLAAGYYIIDRSRIKALKPMMDPREKKRLDKLLKKIEWANLRQNTLHHILSTLAAIQEPFLSSGHIDQMVPISQRALAKKIHVAPSTVSRAVYGKSVQMPWGEEKKLKDLFASRKEVIQRWLSQMLEENEAQEKKLTDEELSRMAAGKFHVRIARRTINFHRNVLRRKRSSPPL